MPHDREDRRGGREHQAEAGRRIRLERNLAKLVELLAFGIEGHRFGFYVVSAAAEAWEPR